MNKVKGRIPWNKGKTGIYSEETLRKIGESGKGRICWQKGKHVRDETKEKLRKYFTGTKLSEETKRKISEALKGRKQTEQHRRNVSQSHRGVKNYRWQGGVESENRRIRHSINFRLWREAVFARDNWTCQECNKRGGTLHPHHIKSFAEYPELRFAIDNGLTLCIKCHLKRHKGIKKTHQVGIRAKELAQLMEYGV
jgi:5-methylcytosine-specific restriction endonuclease McrA